MISEKFDLVELPKSSKKSIGRIRFTDKTDFPGLIVEYIHMKQLVGTNVQMTYKVLRVPRKFKNMDDEYEAKFNTLIRESFGILLDHVVKKLKEADGQ